MNWNQFKEFAVFLLAMVGVVGFYYLLQAVESAVRHV